MNIFLWILQVLMALHTVSGAVWKFSNSEQAVPSLSAIPHGIWLALIGIEFLCSVGLLMPVLSKRSGKIVAYSALVIAAEMLLFCVVHVSSGAGDFFEMIYWLVVAGICAFIAYGRLKLSPIESKSN